jgi:arginine N-succinyltransferase
VTFRLRAAHIIDLEHLYEMAKLTGGGFTNLPADREALTRKLERAEQAFARTNDDLGDDQFTLVLENTETGQVRGTCQLFSQVGQQWPFYSYRLNTLTQHSRELDRTVRAELLSLVTDLEGSPKSAGCSSTRANARAGSACCSPAAAISSSRCTAAALPIASSPNCAV